MSFNKYFYDEMTALRELGKEFAERNPRLAPFLSVEGQDPDVERLLEGFAFLTGRLRQKLDDELPELTHSLMALLWPHFLKPIPAMSMVEFTPQTTVSERQRVRRGVELESRPVDGTPCTFRTCYPVDLYPIAVSDVQLHKRPAGADITISLQRTANVAWSDFEIGELPVYLHGEVHSAQLLYLWMFRYLDGIDVVARSETGETVVITELGNERLEMEGFSPDQALLPKSDQLLEGYRLVQEYFCLPEKFQFFKIKGLEVICQRAKMNGQVAVAQNIELVFRFNRSLDQHINVGKDNFRLFCSPVINLFKHDAIPIRADYKKTEYRVLPSGRNPSHYEIYNIDIVNGWGHLSHHNQVFKRFESFDHYEIAPVDADMRYYRERLKPSVTGNGLDCYITFVNQAEKDVFPETETVSLDLTCSNRHLPMMLEVGDICVDTGTSPEFATFQNITPVTPSLAPPLDQGFHWRLVSNMSLNYQSLTDQRSLKAILSTYDYKSFYDRQQALASQHRLDAFDGIVSEAEDRLYGGLPVRGQKTQLRLKESYFANEGDMFMFASILNELFALNCAINSFHSLQVLGVEKGEIYKWNPKSGAQPIL